jgi:hypothetical protein
MAMSRGRRLSKRQKRRSLKRKNVKSRKVMRGGGGVGDPLLGVKVGDTVTVTMSDIKGGVETSRMIREYENNENISMDCQVTEVNKSNREYNVPKIVTLEAPNDSWLTFSTKIQAKTSYGDRLDIKLNADGTYSFSSFGNKTNLETIFATDKKYPGSNFIKYLVSVSIKSRSP